VFFAIAQTVGALGPVLYGHLIGDGTHRGALFAGYLIGATAMIAGGLVEAWLGIPAERTSLEHIAQPLSATSTTQPDPDRTTNTAPAPVATATRR
jgi:hypothetical protein